MKYENVLNALYVSSRRWWIPCLCMTNCITAIKIVMLFNPILPLLCTQVQLRWALHMCVCTFWLFGVVLNIWLHTHKHTFVFLIHMHSFLTNECVYVTANFKRFSPPLFSFCQVWTHSHICFWFASLVLALQVLPFLYCKSVSSLSLCFPYIYTFIHVYLKRFCVCLDIIIATIIIIIFLQHTKEVDCISTAILNTN